MTPLKEAMKDITVSSQAVRGMLRNEEAKLEELRSISLDAEKETGCTAEVTGSRDYRSFHNWKRKMPDCVPANAPLVKR